MKIQANQFQSCNLKECVERANKLLSSLKELHLSNDDAMALAKAQMLTNHENGDMWESSAWSMVYMEILERQIRAEDKTVPGNPPGHNGGFNDIFVQLAPVAGAERIYTVQISESQRTLLHDMLEQSERDDLAQKLLVDLRSLPEDANYSSVVGLFDE